MLKLGLQSLRYPIICAPMAGASTPEMVAAASRAGALGSFGFAYTTPDRIKHDIIRARALCSNGPINANFFVFQKVCQNSVDAINSNALNHLQAVAPSRECRETVTTPQPPYFPDLEMQLESIWATRPEILSFHFGLPDLSKELISHAHKCNIAVGGTATSEEEATLLAEAGCNFIVAQGVEAGGHRGTFHDEFSPKFVNDEELPTLELLQRIKASLSTGIHSVRCPGSTNSNKMPQLVAAGGIMSGKDVSQMLQMGADAVQMGTIFLPTFECGIPSAYKACLVQESRMEQGRRRSTQFTTAFSGRRARGIENKFMDYYKNLMEDGVHGLSMQQQGQQTNICINTTTGNPASSSSSSSSSSESSDCNRSIFPFPVQNTATQPLRKWAAEENNAEYMSMWAGSNYHALQKLLAYHAVNRDSSSADDVAELTVEDVIQWLTTEL